MSSSKYRPEIDGLRAVAVIPVILFHIRKDLLPGGYIGVDVFFVISGYLITSIIIDENERGVFSFSNFWLRRVRRILPALLAMTLVTLVVGHVYLYAADINNIGAQGFASLLSFANVSHWLLAGDYWGYAAENSPFLHAWSLSVEEQFYLLFPLVLIGLLKYLRKYLELVFFVLSMSSLFLFLFGSMTHPTATFYLLPTRAWELGAGALLAMISLKINVECTKKSYLSTAGILMILMSYIFIDGESGISPLVIIPVLGTAMVIAFIKNSNSMTRHILSLRPLVYIGKLSYSLYLWHWPILFYSKQFYLKENVIINPRLVMVAIFIISVLSYHFVEVPTRRNKNVTPYILGLLLASIVYSFILKVGDYRENTTFYNKTEWDGNLYNVVIPNTELSESTMRRMTGIVVASRGHSRTNDYLSGGIKRLYGADKPEIVVLGDSHALMWARVLDEAAKELSMSIAFFAADGTPTFFNIPPKKQQKGTLFLTAEEKYIFDQSRLKYLAEWKPKIVVIACNWMRIDKRNTVSLIQYLDNIGSRILLIEQPPKLFFGDRNTPQFLSYLGLKPIKDLKQYVRGVNSTDYIDGINLVKKIEENNSHCFRVATSDLYLSGDMACVLDSSDVLYIDDDHLSYSGASMARDRIVVTLTKLIQDESP